MVDDIGVGSEAGLILCKKMLILVLRMSQLLMMVLLYCPYLMLNILQARFSSI